MPHDAVTIPNQYHFVWDDKFFPYTAYLAIRSVAQHCRPDRIYLYKTPALDRAPNFQRLVREIECFRPINIDLRSWLEEAGLSARERDRLLAANHFLSQRNYYGSISDLLRSLKLYLEGGIYLDTDTLTLGDLTPLRQQEAFLAEEHILVSSKVWREGSRWRYFRTVPLTLVRDLCARVPFGVTVFQKLSPLYVRAVHNAVMGFRRGYPLMRDVLLQIADRFPRRPERYPLLGPDTVQDLIAQQRYPGLTVYPPACFSPLSPTMTHQYFHVRSAKQSAVLRTQVVGKDTRAIHWSNNGTISKLTPQSDGDLRRLADQQLFARLAIDAAFGGQL